MNYHFLMDIGAYVVKPDRQIVSLLTRLDLIHGNGRKAEHEAIDICREMAKEAEEKIRVIDIVLVNMGQGSEFNLESPICKRGCKQCRVNYRCKDSSRFKSSVSN